MIFIETEIFIQTWELVRAAVIGGLTVLSDSDVVSKVQSFLALPWFSHHILSSKLMIENSSFWTSTKEMVIKNVKLFFSFLLILVMNARLYYTFLFQKIEDTIVCSSWCFPLFCPFASLVVSDFDELISFRHSWHILWKIYFPKFGKFCQMCPFLPFLECRYCCCLLSVSKRPGS